MTKLVENGWSVSDDGVVYAIINDSVYEVDAGGTPYAKLPPGEYTDEEAEIALKEQRNG